MHFPLSRLRQSKALAFGWRESKALAFGWRESKALALR